MSETSPQPNPYYSSAHQIGGVQDMIAQELLAAVERGFMLTQRARELRESSPGVVDRLKAIERSYQIRKAATAFVCGLMFDAPKQALAGVMEAKATFLLAEPKELA